MSDIEVVVKVAKEDYLTFSKLSEKEKVNELSYYERIIANGIPLPKRLEDYPFKESEIISKDEYGNRLKADIIAILTEMQSEIEELCTPPAYQDEDYFLIGTNRCSELIQQKIDKYKTESEDRE